MDFSASLTTLLIGIVLLVTVPLLIVAARLQRIARILARIEHMNLRSMQRWGG
jgi:hypothetical protein